MQFGETGQESSCSRPAQVVVVGSINMDLVARVRQLPRPGETVHGRDLVQNPGGKGANQAVAASRLGARSALIGRVGDDGFGPQLIEALRSQGVSVDHITITEGCASGVALIGVEEQGENAITIVSGANGCLTPEDVASRREVIAAADVLLVQLEVPAATVLAAVEIARKERVLTVVDPAPVPHEGLPAALHHVDVLTPNATEAEILTQSTIRSIADAENVARQLRGRGAANVVVKLGQAGALLLAGTDDATHVPARAVDVVDTTAAGDAFTAALALAWALHVPPSQAVVRACAAGTLACTRQGAQRSMPNRQQLERFLSQGQHA